MRSQHFTYPKSILLADATSRRRLGLGRNVEKEGHPGLREGREAEEHSKLVENTLDWE